MRVLIVGCGYVGLPLGSELVRQGHQVWGIRRTWVDQEQAQASGIVPLTADITKPPSFAALPRHFEWVVFCVSSTHGGVDAYRQVYVEGMRNLLTWLQSTPPENFVYTSSTSVYGQTDGVMVDETSTTEPSADTAKVLVETENLLLQTTLSPAAVILRVAGIYGPGRGYWLQQFLKGEAKMEGQGERLLNMIHRDDVSGVIIAALKQGQPKEVYNAVDDYPVSQRELFEWLAREFGRPFPPSVPEHEPVRKRALTSKRVSNRKLKAQLGYQFKYSTFREGSRAC